MDIFIEEMVKKQMTIKDILLILCTFLLCAALIAVLFLLSTVFPAFGTIVFLVMAAVVYGTYRVFISFDVEYEYSLVNSEIDIDKILGRKRRKRVTTVKLTGLEAFGKSDNAEYKKYLSDSGVKKIFVCRNSSDNNYFIVRGGDKREMVIFSPSEKIISVIEKFNPRRNTF